MRTWLVVLLLVGSLAGCLAEEGGAPSGAADRDQDGVSDADEIAQGTDPENPDTDGDGQKDGDDPMPAGQQPEPHGEPQRTDSEVDVESTGNGFRATKNVTITNGVGDAQRAHVTQRTTNGGMGAQGSSAGRYTVLVELWADGTTEQEARESLDQMEVRHVDTLEGDLLTLDTRVVFEPIATPIDLPIGDLGPGNRGGAISLELPRWLETSIDQEGTNGGAIAAGLGGPSLRQSMTNGGHVVQGYFDDIDISWTNGGVVGIVGAYSDRAGTWTMGGTNGGIKLVVPTGRALGYDITANIQNGGIDIAVPDTEPVGEQSDNAQHVKTRGFADRDRQTTIDLDGTNGGIEVLGQ